jgi:hypothetical protein
MGVNLRSSIPINGKEMMMGIIFQKIMAMSALVKGTI